MKPFAAMACTILSVALLSGPAAAQELYGTLKKIKDSGTITIGYNEDAPPFTYTGQDGKPQGYSIDICGHIVEAVKQEIKVDTLNVKYQAITGQTRTPLVLNGTVDLVCTTVTNTFARQRQTDFLNSHFVTGSRLLVRKSAGIKEIEDLKGKVVSATPGSTNEKLLNHLNTTMNLGAKIVSVKDLPQAWISLETDRTDAHMTDEVIGYGLIAKAKNPDQFDVVGRMLSFEPYGIVIRRDDSAFRMVGNRALANLFRSGEINKIYEKWLGPLKMPLSDTMKAMFTLQAIPE